MTTRTPQDYAPKCCPFCGGTDIFIEPDERGSGGQWVSPIHVGCADCKCEQCADSEDDAIAIWNRRAPQSGWLPIESAPKDFVTEFDGWNGGRVTDVIWAHPDGAPKGENDWCISEYELNWGWKMERVRGLTHWMPLPLPPSTKGESTNG